MQSRLERQQGFDTTVARFSKAIKSFSVFLKVEELKDAIEESKLLAEVFEDILAHAIANQYGGKTLVRTNELRPIGKSSTKRGGTVAGVPAIQTFEPTGLEVDPKGKEVLEPAPMSLSARLVRIVTNAGRPLGCQDVARIAGEDSGKVSKLLSALYSENKIGRKKVRKKDRAHTSQKFVYEVAA